MATIIRVLLLFIFTVVLSAQERNNVYNVYYEERQKMYKEIPPIGTMIQPYVKVFLEYYDEPTLSADLWSRGYFGFYAGYESLGIFIQGMTEYQNHDFIELSYTRENLGYDNKLIPWIQSKGKFYLNNYYILQRNLSYYFDKFLQTVRIGKLWIDYSPYTIYRTFGPEGVSFEGSIFPVNYHIFYSYNKVRVDDTSTVFGITNIYEKPRHLAGAKFNFYNSSLFSAELIGVYYSVPDIKNDKVISFKISKGRIAGILYIEFLDIEKRHEEKLLSRIYTGYYRQVYLGINFGFSQLNFSYRETSPYFMAYNPVTWTRFSPYADTAYDWIYEEERGIKVNERAYRMEIRTTIGGIRLRNIFDWGFWLDRSIQEDWMVISPPLLLTRVEITYLVGWITVTHKLWMEIEKEAGSTEIPSTPEKSQIFTTEFYLPLTQKISIIPRVELKREVLSDNVINDKLTQFMQINYSTGRLKFKAEFKFSDIDTEEPDWLVSNPYYREQAWGIDNYIRVRMEYEY